MQFSRSGNFHLPLRLQYYITIENESQLRNAFLFQRELERAYLFGLPLSWFISFRLSVCVDFVEIKILAAVGHFGISFGELRLVFLAPGKIIDAEVGAISTILLHFLLPLEQKSLSSMRCSWYLQKEMSPSNIGSGRSSKNLQSRQWQIS